MQKSWMTVAAAIALSGCATQDFVRETVAPVQSRVEGLNQRVTTQESGLKTLDTRVKSSEERMTALHQEALARADAAGKLNQGKFLMSTVLTDDKIKFASGRAQLSAEAGSELEQLLAKLKADNQPVFVEIQGHTDARGSSELNQRLGQQRADAVRQHLAMAGMPLHRMATVSYGESAPLADNGSAEGRRLNRRVQLVVLK
jgi:outer membrane protein OmpA-like peptidoglycan-associated protein